MGHAGTRPVSPEPGVSIGFSRSADTIHRWTFELSGQTLILDAPGGFATDDLDMLLAGALEGLGLACVIECQPAPHVALGAILSVLEDWRPCCRRTTYTMRTGETFRPPCAPSSMR